MISKHDTIEFVAPDREFGPRTLRIAHSRVCHFALGSLYSLERSLRPGASLARHQMRSGCLGAV